MTPLIRITDEELLQKVKTINSITGKYNDDPIKLLITDVKNQLIEDGVHEKAVNSTVAIGIIARGVDDLWTVGGGTVNLSPYFEKRAVKLALNYPSDEDFEYAESEVSNVSTYRPASKMRTPLKLQKATDIEVTGGTDRDYVDAPEDPIVYCNFKTKGGTKAVVNGKLVVINTATIETPYRDDIVSSDRFVLLQDNSLWNIVGQPENVEMQNKLLVITVKNTGGKT